MSYKFNNKEIDAVLQQYEGLSKERLTEEIIFSLMILERLILDHLGLKAISVLDSATNLRIEIKMSEISGNEDTEEINLDDKFKLPVSSTLN